MSYRYEPEGANDDPGGVPWEDMIAAKVQSAVGPRRYATDPEGNPMDLADSDPDRTFLGVLRRELMTAAAAEKETHAALAEHQAKAGALTAERVAIERAIRAYQGGAE